MPFVISFRSQKRAKVIMITFKISLEPPIVVETILDSAKQQKKSLRSFQILSTFFTFI